MKTSHVIILDVKHQIVAIRKIKHIDKRDLRRKLADKMKNDRRLRKLIDSHHIMIVVPAADPRFKLEDEVKKKF